MINFYGSLCFPLHISLCLEFPNDINPNHGRNVRRSDISLRHADDIIKQLPISLGLLAKLFFKIMLREVKSFRLSFATDHELCQLSK